MELLKAGPRTVGAKQTKRCVKDGRAKKVYVAADADPNVTEPITALCDEAGVAWVKGPSMKELGQICGIAVGCAVCAAVTA